MTDIQCPHEERISRIERKIDCTKDSVDRIEKAIVGDVADLDKPSLSSRLAAEEAARERGHTAHGHRLERLESAERRRSWIVRTFAGATLVLAATQVWNWFTGSRQ